MFGIINENKKFILIDENRDILRKTALILACTPMFKEDTVDDAIKEYADDDIEMSYTGDMYIKGFAPKPDNCYQSNMRKTMYTAEIDPITAHISRLRDENQTEEIAKKISDLITERNTKIAEIKKKYPYFDE